MIRTNPVLRFAAVLRSALPTAALLLLASAAAQAGDWPRFRGPTGDGRSEATTAPLKWSDSEGVLWKTPLPGPGSSSPIVLGNRVFVTCYSGYGLDPAAAGDPTKLVRHAICLDLKSGAVLWDRTVPAEPRETPFAGPYVTEHGYASSTPATDGERVYFFFGTSGIVAYDLDGKPAWRADTGRKAHAWGAGSSPVVHGDLLIANAALESDSLVAFDRKTGEKRWSVPRMPNSWNTPLIVPVEGGPSELVVSVSGKVRGIDPLTGTELWTCAGITAAELCPSPVLGDGVVFVLGHPGGQALAVKAGGRGDVTATHRLWTLPKGSNVVSPAYRDGHLYWTGDKNGVAYCVHGASGKVVYEQRLAPRPGTIYASPVLLGDRLYCTSRSAGTYVIAAKPEFELLAHNVLAADESRFAGSPAVVDGRLLLRSDRFLYCLGAK